ncbi:hypothetical protein [Pedobacter sp. ok626]|uniref:hypothetical protein n=1 Tax=Pedobacter sp. ok626 TaxID=1761882 RepID=UPI000B80E07A|nr:hypothetical protein [Pedobacter sp. ok626]
MERVCIYAKDVCKATGRSERQARRLLRAIRIELNKEDHQFITVKEFCDYTGIDPDLIDLD